MTKSKIDLRSDIHNAPTASMRHAMATAKVGGDGLIGEDRLVIELEEYAANLFEKESALFVCSGTMGNIVSLLTISKPGDSLFADPYTHIVSSEKRGFERLAGCKLLPIETDGVLTGDAVRDCLQDGDSGVICVENTHGLRGGIPWGTDVLASLVTVARENDLKLHIDGARIFNAAAALGQSVAPLSAGADTVQVCLSKGLGAPSGSLILGSKSIITQAREYRQMVGGGLHKPGIMAAAGLVALREMPARIPEDHCRAQRLGQLLQEMDGLRLAYSVRTNIVDCLLDSGVDGERLVMYCAKQGLGITGPWNAPAGQWIRMVTCHEITDRDIQDAASILRDALRESRLGCKS